METRVHENTINDKVADIIKESKLFEVQLYEGVQLPSGERRELDFRIMKHEICGEGEWESSSFVGYDQANSFLKVPGAKGAFLIIYPESLKTWKEIDIERLKDVKVKFCYLRKDGGNYIQFHKIKDIPKILKKNIDESVQQIDIRIIIDTIRQAVNLLQSKINSTKMDNIFVNNLFAEDKVDSNIAVTSAAYFLLNQLIFYRIIASSAKYGSKLEFIEPNNITKPDDLDDKYFEKLKEITLNYNAIYNTSLSYLINDTNSLKLIISYVNAIAPEKITGDFLGKVFHQLIPKKIRKKVASYYTLEGSAYILADLLISKYNQKVCDPSCGSGTLLCSAYQVKKKLISGLRPFSKEDHNNFISNELLGADIMPFAAHLSVINLALQDINNFTDDVQIAVMDSNKLKVGFEISSLPDSIQKTLADFGVKVSKSTSEKVSKEPKKIKKSKVIGIDGISKKTVIKIEPQDVIIMNPPFTKKQRLAITKKDKKTKKSKSTKKSYKDELKQLYSNYYKKGYLNGKSPYFAYFLCLADKLLGVRKDKKDQSIGAVLPAVILRNDNEKNLRDYILKNYWIKYIIFREDACNFSEDTSQREILLVLNRRKKLVGKEKRETSFVFIHKMNDENYSEISNILKKSVEQMDIAPHEVFKMDDWDFSILKISQNELNSDNLFYYSSIFSFNYDYVKVWSNIRTKKPFNIISTYEEIEIKSKNAPEPSNCNLSFKNTSFLLKEYKKDKNDMILIDEENDDLNIKDNTPARNELKIPKDRCRLVLRYISQKFKMDISKLKEYIIYNDVEQFDFENANWDIWQKYLDDRTANLVIIDRMDYTTPGYHLLAFYSGNDRIIARTTAAITGISKKHSKLITLWFNSSFGFLEWLIYRTPQRFGYCQHHKFSMEKLVILDEKINNLEKLDEIFDSLKDVEFPSLFEQYLLLQTDENLHKFDEILNHYGLLDNLEKEFSGREQLDKYILEIMVKNMTKKDLVIYFKVLHEKIEINESDSLETVRNFILSEENAQKILENLYYRIFKMILASKVAMDEKFSSNSL